MNKLLGVLVGLAVAGGAIADEQQQRIEESRAAVQAFGKELQGELRAAMQEGGPVQAIEVCHRVAPRIAADLSEEHGWIVGRTTTKLRNPDNAPDAWERAVLEDFERRAAAGEAPGELEHAEVAEYEGQEAFRYMRGIGVGEVCLSCHGANLDESVAGTLKRLYPQDEARGYGPGELRGAFTIVQPLD
ncbi:DUF3365 domain-containing protein [Ectothiorhodospiraceae bacterium 2226]|nr:DUF3365 domain-containing protein [Ectothiorhodospiraceae bacterium 2226]